jgi:formyl-CoA transferase
MDDPHLEALGFLRRMKHPTEGETVLPDVPVRFADSPATIDRLPPRLGEHGREILGEIGMRPDEIDNLARSGAVVLKEKV